MKRYNFYKSTQFYFYSKNYGFKKKSLNFIETSFVFSKIFLPLSFFFNPGKADKLETEKKTESNAEVGPEKKARVGLRRSRTRASVYKKKQDNFTGDFLNFCILQSRILRGSRCSWQCIIHQAWKSRAKTRRRHRGVKGRQTATVRSKNVARA